MPREHLTPCSRQGHMVFNSNIFLFGFLPIVLGLFWLMKTKQQRYVLLTVSGFVFYSYWNWKEQHFHLREFAAWKYTCLLLFSCIVGYVSGLLIQQSEGQ